MPEISSKMSSKVTGISLAVLGALMMALYGVLMNLTLSQLNVYPFLTTRFFVLSLLSAIPVVNHPEYLNIRRKEIGLTVLASVSGASTSFIAFYSFNYIPPLDSLSLAMTLPVFTLITGCVFLKEKCTILRIVTVFFVFVSVILICQPEFIFKTYAEQDTTKRIIGSMLALSSALADCVTCTIIRKINCIPAMTQTFTQGVLITTIYLIVFGGLMRDPQGSTETGVLLACSVIGASASIFTTLSLYYIETIVYASLFPLQIVFTAILQILILGIIPNFLTVVGSCLMILCLILLSLEDGLKNISCFRKKCEPTKAESRLLLENPKT